VSWGVGGVEDVAASPHEKLFLEVINHLRDVLLRDGRGPLLQSPSAGESGALGGPMSPRPLNVPNLRPGPSSSLGLNLLPIVHVSSLSAAPAFSEAKNAEFLRLEAASGSGGGGGRVGRLERQSLEVSETETGGGARSDGGPSWRRREESREPRSGRGPCRRHSPENFGSSELPKPERSLAKMRP
jgi:hypothetical protein